MFSAVAQRRCINHLSTLVALIILVNVSGCEQADQSITYGQSPSPIKVTDYLGNAVQLEKPASKIIALAPHIVENVYSAGAGQTLMGTVSYSDFPEQAKDIEVIGSFNKINYERILALKPDLIIAWQSSNNVNAINRLKEMGFAVYVDQPQELEDVATSIKAIGILAGTQQAADIAAEDYLQKLEHFRSRYSSDEKVSAFYQVWNQPLQTINGAHIISDVIDLCGGYNIYADEQAVAPIINIESILDKNPSVILSSGTNNNQTDWLTDWAKWPSLNAVKNNRLFFVPPDHVQRHTVRLLLGVQTVCEQFAKIG
jgi:iron complex transport system substrate-binding protein